MFTFNRGDINTVMLTVLRLTNSAPAFPADYAIPQLRVSHVNGAGEIEDLAFTNMTQIGSTNRWFHKFSVPTNASFTKYLVTFKTTLDGIESYTTEEFKVVPETGSESGGGEFNVELTFKQATNNQAISNATIRIFDKSNPTVVVAQATTDSSGKAFLFLNAGSYLLSVKKTGLISEVHDLIVNSDGTHKVIGD